jgi:two-component system sensor histidine kinase UhpB
VGDAPFYRNNRVRPLRSGRISLDVSAGIFPEKPFLGPAIRGLYNDASFLRVFMSFQFRVLGSIALLLLLALLCGGALLLLHARSVAELEVHTAFRGAERSIRDTLQGNVEHTVTLRQVVASFEGQRHVRAALVNETGKVIVQSQIARLENIAPGWFARLMTPPHLSSRIPINLPGFPCVVVLTSDPRSEISEVWYNARNAFVTMLIFCAATMAVVSLAFTYAFGFLRRFQSGLLQVAQGHYDTRLDTKGAPELAALARGFNHMTERLAAFSDSNQRLQRQIQNVQEEERAGIARDLHDEVGPYLFAIQADANAIAKSGDPPTRELSGAIREAAQHIQRHVKDILRQLRPTNDLEFGLEAAISDLILFWSRRYPGIRFEPAIAPGTILDPRSEEVAYRIVRESLSNAVRHGKPQTIRIAIAEDANGASVCVEDDGGGLKQSGAGLGHMGLAGMEDRVRALKGQFVVENLQGRGVRVRAFLPKAREMEVA